MHNLKNDNYSTSYETIHSYDNIYYLNDSPTYYSSFFRKVKIFFIVLLYSLCLIGFTIFIFYIIYKYYSYSYDTGASNNNANF